MTDKERNAGTSQQVPTDRDIGAAVEALEKLCREAPSLWSDVRTVLDALEEAQGRKCRCGRSPMFCGVCVKSLNKEKPIP